MSKSTEKALFHYTATPHWLSIRETDSILSSWRRVMMEIPIHGFVAQMLLRDHERFFWHWNRLVWLSSDLRPVQSWQGANMQRKGEIRITVQTSRAAHWPEYAAEHDLPLNAVCRGDSPADWWVVRDQIPCDEWTLVRRTEDDEILWTPHTKNLSAWSDPRGRAQLVGDEIHLGGRQ